VAVALIRGLYVPDVPEWNKIIRKGTYKNKRMKERKRERAKNVYGKKG
jgi:hypothetical protein